MKFTIATIFALTAVASAYPAVVQQAPVRRQNIETLDAQVPSMSDQNGNVVPFDASRVAAAKKN
ncbi:hypothetical protein VTK56DRAFT_4735 [Thermocarpiscus australiensis]